MMTLKVVSFVLLFGIVYSNLQNTTESEFWWQQLGSKISQNARRLDNLEHDQDVSRHIKKLEENNQEEKALLQEMSNYLKKIDTKLENCSSKSERNTENENQKSEFLQMSHRLEDLENKFLEQNVLIQNLSTTLENLQKPKKISEESLPRDCLDVKNRGFNKSDVYTIKPKLSPREFSVQCEMDTRNGGWTQVLRRIDGTVDFNQNWQKYKEGFGSLTGEFWLGLDYLYYLTGDEANELLIEFSEADKIQRNAHFDNFGIGAESEAYPLKVLSGFSGDVQDKLTYHNDQKFTTFDKDQDLNSNNCASMYGGGWWHKSCHTTHLTGRYIVNGSYGISWEPYRAIKNVKMMVRPRRN